MEDKEIINKGIFDPAMIDRETEAFNKKLEALFAAIPPSYTMTPEQIREGIESGKSFIGQRKLMRGCMVLFLIW